MISMQNIAVTASFMTVGMMDVNAKYLTIGRDGRYERCIYTVWDKGAIELHMELCQYAELSEKIVNIIVTEFDIDFPGVYDYEVSEPFGAWFGEYIFEHTKAPTADEAKTYLLELACMFFSQSHSPKAADCVALMNKVREHL